MEFENNWTNVNGINAFMKPIEDAPRDGSYVIILGPSGYTNTPLRAEICKYDEEFRPLNPWVDYAGDAFTDSGPKATHFLSFPEYNEKKHIAREALRRIPVFKWMVEIEVAKDIFMKCKFCARFVEQVNDYMLLVDNQPVQYECKRIVSISQIGELK